MSACLISASFTNEDWFIGTYNVRQVNLRTDDLLMIASPVFGGPLVHVWQTSHSVFGGRREPVRVTDRYALNIISCGPEDAMLVLEHLGDLMKEGRLPLPDREKYQHEVYRRYRDDELTEVEEWFEVPQLTS